MDTMQTWQVEGESLVQLGVINVLNSRHVSVLFGCDRFVYLDLRLLGAWKKFHTYSPKLWFNDDLPSYKVKKIPTQQIQVYGIHLNQTVIFPLAIFLQQ